MTQHRSDFKRNRIKSSSELIKHGDAYIELIEKFPCKDREELFKREGEVMRATLNTVNNSYLGGQKRNIETNTRLKLLFNKNNIMKITKNRSLLKQNNIMKTTKRRYRYNKRNITLITERRDWRE